MRIRIVGLRPDLERLAEQVEGLVEMVPFPCLDFKAWGVADENQYLALDEGLIDAGHGWTEGGLAYRLDCWRKGGPPLTGLLALSAAYPTLVIALSFEVECAYTSCHCLFNAGQQADGWWGVCGREDVRVGAKTRFSVVQLDEHAPRGC
jgi:hypothetical protein